MGSGYSIEPDQDSVTNPGEKVVLTTELEGCKYEDLIDGTFDYLKLPSPHVEPVLKNVEVKDESESGYTVKVILDGAKLDQFGFGNGKGTDRVNGWLKVEVDRAAGMIHTQSYVPMGGQFIDEASDAKAFFESFTKVLKDPVRIEYYMVVDGARMAGPAQAALLKTFVDPIVEMSKTRKVRFLPDQDSIAEPGKKSVISEPMDEHISYDTLWTSITDWKSGFEGKEITEVSENEVFASGEGGVEPADGATTVTFDKEKGTINRTRTIAGKVQETSYTVVHQDPLRMEVWVEAGEEKTRLAGRHIAMYTTVVVEQVISKASSWW